MVFINDFITDLSCVAFMRYVQHSRRNVNMIRIIFIAFVFFNIEICRIEQQNLRVDVMSAGNAVVIELSVFACLYI